MHVYLIKRKSGDWLLVMHGRLYTFAQYLELIKDFQGLSPYSV